jgi:hypothetical protein
LKARGSIAQPPRAVGAAWKINPASPAKTIAQQNLQVLAGLDSSSGSNFNQAAWAADKHNLVSADLAYKVVTQWHGSSQRQSSLSSSNRLK